MKKTALYSRHLELGARMVDFGGWAMPVQYTHIIEEHHATRRHAGLFDICHMGEIAVRGTRAFDFLKLALSRNLQDQREGQMKLGLLLNSNGGIIDDVTLYCLNKEDYLLVTNAATKNRDFEWLKKIRRDHGFDRVDLIDRSEQTGKIDVQGPASEAILQKLFSDPLSDLRFYHCLKTKISNVAVLISRSGYTGEDGFELYAHVDHMGFIWDELLKAGNEEGIRPAGLGARDTLRLEAGMMLNGRDMNETITPYEVVYGWVTNMDKEFIGKQALKRLKQKGFEKKLVGFEVKDRAIAREGYRVFRDGEVIGQVTSGTFSPTLERPIGFAFVPVSCQEPGTSLAIEIRGHLAQARVVSLPFYKRSQKLDKRTELRKA